MPQHLMQQLPSLQLAVNSFFLLSSTSMLCSLTEAARGSRFAGHWIAPLDDESRLRMLCTDSFVEQIVMKGRQSGTLNNLVRHKQAMCNQSIVQQGRGGKYQALLWFMQSLGFCAVVKEAADMPYQRSFQLELLRAGFSLVCRRIDDDRDDEFARHNGVNGAVNPQLQQMTKNYADTFRVMYERANADRSHVCDSLISIYEGLYRRCHVPNPTISLDLVRRKCEPRHQNESLLNIRAFFTRFSRADSSCVNPVFKDYYHHYSSLPSTMSLSPQPGAGGASPHTPPPPSTFHQQIAQQQQQQVGGGGIASSKTTPRFNLGQALATDTAFLNTLSRQLKRTVLAESNLLHLILKTRLTLQHFALASMPVAARMRAAYRCKLVGEQQQQQGGAGGGGEAGAFSVESAQQSSSASSITDSATSIVIPTTSTSSTSENVSSNFTSFSSSYNSTSTNATTSPPQLMVAVAVLASVDYLSNEAMPSFGGGGAGGGNATQPAIPPECDPDGNGGAGLDSSASDPAIQALIDAPLLKEYERLAGAALFGVRVELALVVGITANTAALAGLLRATRKQLSTATILFVCNILFSNALFVASFGCLFADLATGEKYGEVKESLAGVVTRPRLLVAELLKVYLFSPSVFLKNLTQETLFSLAQNGSLLGLTHLLLLVLLVIHRSASGKAIRLSRRCVIAVFATVWALLLISHVGFSALQYSAVRGLNQLIAKVDSNDTTTQLLMAAGSRCGLSGGPDDHDERRHELRRRGEGKEEGAPASSSASSTPSSSSLRWDYADIGEQCDRVAMFDDFGVYLLRGHTLFTLSFLSTSIVVYAATLLCHWRVRKQHDNILNSSAAAASIKNRKESAPNHRRTKLFNTLLLSLGAFFLSVSPQSFIEIAVFWMDDGMDIAELASWYQLARIAAFIDPLLNPALVALRTPSMRRRVHFYACLTASLLCALCCPWRHQQHQGGGGGGGGRGGRGRQDQPQHQHHQHQRDLAKERRRRRRAEAVLQYRQRYYHHRHHHHGEEDELGEEPKAAYYWRNYGGGVGGMHNRKQSLSVAPSLLMPSRRQSAATFVSSAAESEITLRIFCTGRFIRASFLRRGSNSTTALEPDDLHAKHAVSVV